MFVPTLAFAGALTEDYVDIASSLARDGKYSQAMTYINKALSIEPQNSRLMEIKNSLMKVSGQNVHTVVAVPRNNTYSQAEQFRVEKDYPKAAAYYKKGINENPTFAPNYLGLAVVCYEMKNFREAKSNLDIYLNKEPRSDFAFMLRAKSNMNIGETQSALRDIKSAQAVYSNPEYQLTEAIILAEMGKYQQARDILDKISEDLQIAIVYKYLGICDYKLGNYKNAILNFDRAIILFEDDKTILPMYNDTRTKIHETEREGIFESGV